MSLTRQLFHDHLSPFFRVLDEPFGPPGFFGPVGRSQSSTSPFYGHPFARSILNDPFFQQVQQLQQRPSIHLTEDDNQYVVEADLPGVKKENVDVRIGDGGRSVTIEGKVFHRQTESEATGGEENRAQSAPPQTNAGQQQQQQPAQGSSNNEKAVSQTPQAGEIQNQQQGPISTSSSRFTRSVWLPRPVDGSTVKAKLENGILTLTIPKPHDKESVKVNVE